MSESSDYEKSIGDNWKSLDEKREWERTFNAKIAERDSHEATLEHAIKEIIRVREWRQELSTNELLEPCETDRIDFVLDNVDLAEIIMWFVK